jgi:peptidoglycan/xylan/chitin deacetylase (PgdA/CDA1 family)
VNPGTTTAGTGLTSRHALGTLAPSVDRLCSSPRVVVALGAVALTVLAGCGTPAGRSSPPTRRSTTTLAPTTTTTTAPDGPLPVPPSLVGTQWSSLPTDLPEVALTFDCGSNDAGIPAILSALVSGGATATFTLTGVFAQTYPQAAKQIAADGFDIADHTYDHMDMTKISLSAAQTEVTRGAQVIEAVTGRNPQPLFRFPYGAWNSELVHMINTLGYGAFYWTVDTLGWEGTTPTPTSAGGQSVASVEARALGSLTPGEIVLMHCGSAPDGTTLDADALPAVIAGIKAKGYRFVTLHGFLESLGSSSPSGSSTKYTPS